MIALALAASLLFQDTNTVVSPRVRAMLERFPIPSGTGPAITIRFSRDTVWVGEQVELVTVTWFPKPLRDRLRHGPGLTPPALTGLWSVRNQQLPIPVGTRKIGGQLFDIYVSWQTIFPLGGGRIETTPASLSYNLPTSTSYFAPEEKKSVRSGTAVLVVRDVPPTLTGALGNGPSAHNLRIAWRSPVSSLRAGSPAVVELALSGEGNLALWPAPQVTWPANLHVYAEPTDEHTVAPQGLIGGEKRFRFTIVTDTAGVLALPQVTYPYFDPATVQVVPATAAALSLVVLPRTGITADRSAFTVDGNSAVPFAAVLVRRFWFLLVLVGLAPLAMRGIRRRPDPAPRAAPGGDPERALRLALGTPVEAGEDHVVAALRQRGIPRDDAEHVRRWLRATGRWRYGPSQQAREPEPPPAVSRVLERLQRGSLIALLIVAAVPLYAQQGDALSRFAGRDYAGAARAFTAATAANPLAAGAWRDLGAARWVQQEDVAATAAWLHALALAPRDPTLRADWRAATGVPADIRAMAPIIPVSRDEFLLIAVACWLGWWFARAFGLHRTALIAGIVGAGAVAMFGLRFLAERPGQVLVQSVVSMRISPHPATAAVGELPAWTRLRIDRSDHDWVLVTGTVNVAGSVGSLSVRGWIPASSIAPIGPLD